MTKRLTALLVALCMAVVANGELLEKHVTATTTNTTISVNGAALSIKNDSENTSVWFRVFVTGETPAAATIAEPSVELKFGERVELTQSGGIKAVSLITDSGTVDVRITYW